MKKRACCGAKAARTMDASYAALTESGKAALRHAWPVYREVIEEDFAKSMSADEARALSRTLKRW